jgi:hypothetical protein
MKKRVLLVVLAVAAWLSLGSNLCGAQEVVHALTGTVSAANSALKTITVQTDDGSEGSFKDIGATHTHFTFDKGVGAQAMPVGEFTKVGSHVIVYYFGDGNVRTAVAVKDLGPVLLHKSAGLVTAFDRHRHLLTLKSDAGQTEEIAIHEQTSIDTAEGVVEGFKFEANKGDPVRVTWTAMNGQDTALFIYAD